MLPNIYRRVVLQQPFAVLLVLFLVLVFFALQARHFALDASADSLLLEDDKDLQIFREGIFAARGTVAGKFRNRSNRTGIGGSNTGHPSGHRPGKGAQGDRGKSGF